MIIKLLTLAITIILFLGCSSKKEQDLLNSYKNKVEYHKNLQQTESAELKIGEDRGAMITATYMFKPCLDKNDTRNEVFIVAIEFEDEYSRMNFQKKSVSASSVSLVDTNNTEQNTTKIFEEYILTLQGKKALKVERINFKDKRLKNLSFITEWGHYYQVTYKNTKSKRFTLKFANHKYGNTYLKFSKVAKFVYSKKGF